MKHITTLYQGGQEIRIAQCLLCKEVFSFVVRKGFDGGGAFEKIHDDHCQGEETK